MAIVATVTDGKIDQSNYKDKTKEKQSGGNLDYDSFLQLLCAEMQYQDPLEPTSNTEYVAQLATFSQLEATLSMTDKMTDSLSAQRNNMANGIVGKYVIVKDAESPTSHASGIVDYIEYNEDGSISASIGNKMYPIEDIVNVATDEYYEAIVTSQTFSGMVAALPPVEEVTTAYKGAIEQLREMYDGLTEYQKSFISEKDLMKLKIYEDKLKEVTKTDENVTDDTKKEDSTDKVDNTNNTDSGSAAAVTT